MLREARLYIAAVVALALLLTGVLTGALWFVGRSLPALQPDITSGVAAPVTVHRDAYGVPHVHGLNAEDVFFVQGYLHAQDRLFQMDLVRRAATGRLAEILGPEFLDSDKFALAVGFLRAARRAPAGLTPGHRAALEGYAAGVNAFIRDHQGRLPLEFTLLGHSPDPWQAVDSLAVANYLAWNLGGDFLAEIFFWQLANQVGPEKAATVFAPSPAEGAAAAARLEALPAGAALAGGLARLREAAEKAALPGPARFKGSTAWAVAGGLTASGKPLLANDVHLALSAPSVLYQNHLAVEGGFDVTGVSVPGIPGVIAGHNGHIAWGLTGTGGDTQDLYLERRHPSDPASFEYEGQWYRAEVERHEIRVRDEPDPVRFEVYLTRHGPLISETTGMDVPVSLRWTGQDAAAGLTAALDLLAASSWDEFCRALEGVPAPAFVYADREGNIGYHAGGLLPSRRAGDGRLPVPGWTAEYEWAGLLPPDQVPRLYNPAEGFVVATSPAPPYRSQAIIEDLQGRRNLTLEDLISIQNNRVNRQARRLGPILLRELALTEPDGIEALALQEFERWLADPRDDPDAAGPAIFHTLYLKLLETAFRDQLGDDLFIAFLQHGNAVDTFDRMLMGGQPEWFSDRGRLVRAGFHAAVAELEAALGRDPARWEWGQFHPIVFDHPLGGAKPLHLVFNRGPHPVGISHLVPDAAAAAWRCLVDLDDGSGLDVMAIGVSGHPFSAHYDDQLVLWLKGEYRPLLHGDQAAGQAAITVFHPR